MGFFGNSSNSDRVLLTTTDLKRDYDIIDIVMSKEITFDQKANFDAGKKSLQERAADIGADAVIGVHCFLSDAGGMGKNTRRWYGTAVRYK